MAGFCKDVSDSQFETAVLENPKPSLVEFWAPWCGPCRMIGPLLEKLAEEYVGDVDIFKMNVDENEDIPSKLQVRGIPHLMLFHKGELIDSVIGAPEPKRIVDMLENALDDV